MYDDFKGFMMWCAQRHIILTEWQRGVACLLLSEGKAAGKSFLINALWEFDKRSVGGTHD